MTMTQRRQNLEIATGLVVCLLFIALLCVAISSSGRSALRDSGSYLLSADFSHIDGLQKGADVKLAGIVVGVIDEQSINPSNYKAHVVFHVRPDIRLSTDTSAIITSDSLMSDKYLSLFPGADDKMLKAGDKITQTQGSIGIEQLLSKFLMSMTNTLTQLQKNVSPKSPAK